ncbi:MAG: hypothetical protein WDN09_00290 [bacterium]
MFNFNKLSKAEERNDAEPDKDLAETPEAFWHFFAEAHSQFAGIESVYEAGGSIEGIKSMAQGLSPLLIYLGDKQHHYISQKILSEYEQEIETYNKLVRDLKRFTGKRELDLIMKDVRELFNKAHAA